MAILGQREKAQVAEMLEAVKSPVSLLVFAHEGECELCVETQQLAEEIAALSSLVRAESIVIEQDPASAEEYGIQRAPAIAIVGARDFGVRFYGLPNGYEFGALIEDIIDASKGEASLGSKTRRLLDALTKPVHLQVFTTPTCPICPNMVRLAHKLAIESDLIRSDAVDSAEFEELAARYEVLSVPRTIINETLQIDGMVPEGKLVQEIIAAFE